MEENRTGYTIMIADDDPNVHQSLNNYFRRERYNTISVYDGESAVKQAFSAQPHLIIMDIMMPKVDGIEALREIRKKSNTPIIMLSAKTEEFDKVVGLEMGADDYIAKPFGMMELTARIRAALRHTAPPAEDEQKYLCGPISLNAKRHLVQVNGREITLTLKEFQVLELLIEHPGSVLSREHLLSTVWGYEFDGASRTIDVHIRTLRQKLESYGKMIETVRNVGYRWEVGYDK